MLNGSTSAHTSRVAAAPGRPHPAMRLWMTLAYRDTAPLRVGVTSAELRAFGQALVEREQTAQAALVAQIAREVTHAESARRNRPGLVDLGAERYIWAFGRVDDALTAFHANHRSDYAAYPEPRTLREASLDRLYRRFPLNDYPRTSVLLFAGVRVCDDPRLQADPAVDTLATLAPEPSAQSAWDNYTCCGFRSGLSLVRVSTSTRWLRVGMRELEDAWAGALDAVKGASAGALDAPQFAAAQAHAHEALLRGAVPEAFVSLDGQPDPTVRRSASPPTRAPIHATASSRRQQAG